MKRIEVWKDTQSNDILETGEMKRRKVGGIRKEQRLNMTDI